MLEERTRCLPWHKTSRLWNPSGGRPPGLAQSLKPQLQRGRVPTNHLHPEPSYQPAQPAPGSAWQGLITCILWGGCSETYLIVVCCGSHSKAPKSSCELFRESGHEASITKCFSPSGNLGHGDLVFPHIWKSEIISLFSRNITVIENLF